MIEALLQAERLLVYGLTEQAERIYLNAIEQDPRNAIAVVGLARIALEHGDERLAYDRACSALEIDPRNAAALRLEARLSEVFASRGEEVARPSFLAVEHAPAPAAPAPAAPREEPPPAPESSADARPSEGIVFTRNPSMAEHQRMEERRAAGRAEAVSEASDEAPPIEQRPGFFRRLWGG